MGTRCRNISVRCEFLAGGSEATVEGRGGWNACAALERLSTVAFRLLHVTRRHAVCYSQVQFRTRRARVLQ